MQFFVYYDKTIHSNIITNVGTSLEKKGTRSQIMIVTTSLFQEKTFETNIGTRFQYKTTFIDTYGSNVIIDLYSVFYLENGSICLGGNVHNTCSDEKYSGQIEKQKIISGTGKYLEKTGQVTMSQDKTCRIVSINIDE